MSRVAFFLQALTTWTLFGLIVLGASVRLTDAGLACPDWPLCLGEAVPTFNFEIFMEWIHRVIAAFVGLTSLVVAILVFCEAEMRRRFSGWVLASLALFFFQAWLGMQTVIELLRAEIVTAHLLGGYSLFAVNLVLLYRMKFWRQPACLNQVTRDSRLHGLWIFASIAVVIQAGLGGLVSSHYAGLACPDFPTCHGMWWPMSVGTTALHMIHRYGAYVVWIVILGLAWMTTKRATLRRLKVYGWLAFGLVNLQILWGILMIFQMVPIGLSLLHSLTALTLFLQLVLGVVHVRRSDG